MKGAILGDIIGSPYEFDRGEKTKDFPLFSYKSTYTDDTIMTVAVAEGLMNSYGKSDEEIKKSLIQSMQKWGNQYYAGYGVRFQTWLETPNPKPYGSWGNGAAMRVSPVGWLYDDPEVVLHIAKLTAEVSHNHPEGIKGAQAVALAVLFSRLGIYSKTNILYNLKKYDIDYKIPKLDDIRPTYHHVESCQETVPPALAAFFESNGFEDAIRNAVSLGGDTDTLACITGGIAEAFYGLPEDMVKRYENFVPDNMKQIIENLYKGKF